MPTTGNIEDLLRQHFHEAILQRIPVGIFTLDTLGRVTLANPAMLEILGSPGLDATIGLNALELPPIRQTGMDEPIRRVLKRGETVRGTTRYVSLWNRAAHLEYQFLPLREPASRGRGEGPVIGLLGILHDVTHQEVAAERLRQTVRDLEQVQAERQALTERKDLFLANVSHELRSPLVAILGYVQMMDSGRLGTLPSEMERPLRTLRQQAEHLQELIEQLLVVTEQLQSGDGVNSPVDLRPLVAQRLVAEERRAATPQPAGASRPTVELQFGPGLEGSDAIWVRGEPVRLGRVLRVLLDNALAFARQRIVVRLERLEPPAGDDPAPPTDGAGLGWLRLQVCDDGPGIPEEHRQLVFSRFFQVDTAPSRAHGGLGLGLAIAHQMVEELGGRISAESSPLGGACVRVDLRLSEPGPLGA